jgi:putative membrane protein
VLPVEDLPPPLTSSTAFTQWEFAPWLTLGLVAIAGLYLYGVVRLTRRGDHWPLARTISFVGLGLGCIAIATMSSLGAYDDTLFYVHMLQHMVLQMVAPVFLALGAPVTLALRATGPRTRRVITRCLHSRISQVLAFPPVGAAAFAATPFLLYFTGWYAATLNHDWLHQLQHVLFIGIGAMFVWPLLGIDPVPRRSPYPIRLMTTFLILPAHAILGITIMQSKTLLAGSYYRSLGRAWGPSLFHDQNIGGGILWAAGDLLGLLFFGVLLFQWSRADSREARRLDRHLDRDDRSLEEYNAMLARLAERDAPAS